MTKCEYMRKYMRHERLTSVSCLSSPCCGASCVSSHTVQQSACRIAQRPLELAFAWALAEARTRSQSCWRQCSIGEGLLEAGFGSDPSESQWNGAAGLREPQVARRECGEMRRLRSRRSSVHRMPRALSSSEALMAAPCVGPVAAELLSAKRACLPSCCIAWPLCTRVGGEGEEQRALEHGR